MKLLEKRYIGLYLFIIMVVVLILAFKLNDSVPVGSGKVDHYDTDWTYEHYEYEGEDGRTILRLIMSHEITDDVRGKSLSFRTYDSFVDADISDTAGDLSGEAIYHFGEKPVFGCSPGTYTHFIYIPENGGKYINITVDTVFRSEYMPSYRIRIGAENELIYSYLKDEFELYTINVIMGIFGVLLLVIHVICTFKKIEAPEAFSLGSLSILFALYVNCPLFFNQYIFGNPVMQYYMNYFMIFMVPLAAMLYFEDIVPTLKLGWLFFTFAGLEVILSVLHFTGVATYTETVKVFITSLGVMSFITFAVNVKRLKLIDPINRLGILILLGFSFANAIFFIFVTTLGDQTFIVRIGFIMYLAFELVNGIRKLMNEMSRKREDQLLEILAYTDQLTGLGNRYALERDAGIIPLEEMSVVSMDLNLLKPTNDCFGHLGGDTLLRSAAKCMSTVFANVYRVGGDEFIALLKDKTEEDLEKLNDELQSLMDRMNSERDEYGAFAYEESFSLSIAIGHSSYTEGDESYEQILSRADKAMYEEKQRMHRISGAEIR